MDKEQQYNEYLTELLRLMQEEPGKLGEVEKSLGKMYLTAQTQIRGLVQERESVAKQITQLQAKEQQLVHATDTELGKASGLAEALVKLKFGEDHVNGAAGGKNSGAEQGIDPGNVSSSDTVRGGDGRSSGTVSPITKKSSKSGRRAKKS